MTIKIVTRDREGLFTFSKLYEAYEDITDENHKRVVALLDAAAHDNSNFLFSMKGIGTRLKSVNDSIEYSHTYWIDAL